MDKQQYDTMRRERERLIDLTKLPRKDRTETIWAIQKRICILTHDMMRMEIAGSRNPW